MSITRDLLAFRSIPPLDADFTATTVGTARRLGITSPSPMPALTDEVIE